MIKSNFARAARRFYKCTVLPAFYGLLGRQVVHFLHIGKTAGTSAIYILKKSRPKSSVIIVHSHDVGLRHIPRGNKVIFFLRDPLTRFVSGFNSRKRQGRPRLNIPYTPKEETAFKKFQSANELGRALSSEDAVERRAAEEAMNEIGHVKSHFSDWLEGTDYLTQRAADILFVGQQEQFDKDMTEIAMLLDFEVEVAPPENDTLAHRSPSGVQMTLDELAETNLKNWYAEDFELRGFIQSTFIKPANA